MGGLTRRQQTQDEWLAACSRLRAICPPGWTIDGRRCRPVDTPVGAHARGQQVFARCRRADCRRRVDLDCSDLARTEHRDRPMAEVLELLRCRHWRGCLLELEPPTYPEGVPLITLVPHIDAWVGVQCERCPHLSALPPIVVIEWLIRTGGGDAGTGIKGLSDVFRGRCPRCGWNRFVVEAHYR